MHSAAQDDTFLDDCTMVFDVDGTLCFDGRSIDAALLDTVRRCRNRRPVAFASARPIRDLLPVLPEDLHDCLLIGGNGAFVRGPGIERTTGFEAHTRTALDHWLDEHALSYLIDGDWNYSFTGDTERAIFRQLDPAGLAEQVDRSALEQYTKVVAFTSDEIHLATLRSLGVTVHRHNDEGHIDISPPGVDKAAALHASGVVAGSYIAFGNDANDIGLLSAARHAVCVGNHPAVAALAHQQTDRAHVALVVAELIDRAL